MLRKNVKSLLEQLQVCIFAEIVFGVRCTLTKLIVDSILTFTISSTSSVAFSAIAGVGA